MEETKNQEVVLAAESPNQLIALALERQADPNTLSKLMDLQERWEAGQARKAYVAAMTAFKQEAPAVLKKNDTVDFTTQKGRTRYNYANLGSIVQEITAILGKHELSASWSTHQDGNNVTVTCHVTHIAGHRESVTLTGPIDESGNKNRIQAVGSTVTYLQRYTLLAALGLATGEDDDNAGGNGQHPEMKEPQKKQTPAQTAPPPATEGKKVITPILNVTKTSGVNSTTKKPWTKYVIFGHLDGNETAFNTFSQTFADMAVKEKGTGATFEITYEKSQYGCDIKDMKQTEPGPEENAQ